MSLNRRVALKMVLAGVHSAPEHMARIRREAEAVARVESSPVLRAATLPFRPFIYAYTAPGFSAEMAGATQRAALDPSKSDSAVQ